MTDLIKRLEEAEEGCRELDRDISKLIDKAEWDRCANWASMPCGAPPAVIERDAIRWLPFYTTSLDAAVALAERVLPGWDFVVGRTNGGLTIHAQVGPNEMQFGNTPALALCAAILKATDTGRE